MPALAVRPMTPADLDRVGVLAGQLVRLHHGWDPRRFFLEPGVEEGYRRFFARLIGQRGVVLLVAESDGQVAGYLYGSVERRDWARLLDDHGAIHDVFIDPHFRRQGLARALLHEALGALRRAGARQVVLSTASPNHEAQALFRKLGFRDTMVEMTHALDD